MGVTTMFSEVSRMVDDASARYGKKYRISSGRYAYLEEICSTFVNVTGDNMDNHFEVYVDDTNKELVLSVVCGGDEFFCAWKDEFLHMIEHVNEISMSVTKDRKFRMSLSIKDLWREVPDG